MKVLNNANAGSCRRTASRDANHNLLRFLFFFLTSIGKLNAHSMGGVLFLSFQYIHVHAHHELRILLVAAQSCTTGTHTHTHRHTKRNTMKTLQSSLRGRDGGGNYRGRSRGGHGGGRGGSGDSRFAARFTDPRFKVSAQASRHARRSTHEAVERAAQSDPRFAKHFHTTEKEQDAEASDTVSTVSSDTSEHTSSALNGSHSRTFREEGDGDMSLPREEEEALDDEAVAWVPDDVEYTEARRRVAVVNCDWDHVRAVDLYAILFHALPLGGQLLDVSVYISEFGKRMLQHEKMHGPDLWVHDGDADIATDIEHDAEEGSGGTMPEVEELPEDISEDAVSEPRSDGWTDDDPKMMTEQGEDGEWFSDGKYRRYEMDRMKYYYAVATFDSADTAAMVYNELDGMDIEASGVVLDLRYVDDQEKFENPVSRADRIPANFKPLASFKMRAVSQSKFRISWDQDDVFRHQSLQDSFTGTTEEDDLAAYLAPPDSDDEVDGNPLDQEKKAREKRNIRRRYAALLEEVGGIPEEREEDENRNGLGGNAEVSRNSIGDLSDSDVDGLDDSSDDNSINRFSDVEMGSENMSEEGDEEDEGSVMGDMEATFDMDADTKAVSLQRNTRMRQKMKAADIAKQAELKYKVRRKEMKKSKKDMLRQEREAGKAYQAAHEAEDRQKLRELMGTDDIPVKVSGKERRKAHAKQVKQRLAEERSARKKMRAANQLGVTQQVQRTRREQEAEKAVEQIDDRFKSKLLSDPRFHLEVSQKDKRVADDVVHLATTVAKARQGKRGRSEGDGKHTAAGNTVDDTVDFFLTKKKKAFK
ncbi:hypothetical protein, conserved [Leishmania tarentolae]|uniref:ESF1 RRM domain-containing protein n=1 Tax=Leishmania tarentolae TaxID=5689 RepID=A0A640KWL8_LEITA|nr:hypothetical protein, conserved [Leishmania tarentolae]